MQVADIHCDWKWDNKHFYQLFNPPRKAEYEVILMFVGRQQPLVAAVIITAAKEEVRE